MWQKHGLIQRCSLNFIVKNILKIFWKERRMERAPFFSNEWGKERSALLKFEERKILWRKNFLDCCTESADYCKIIDFPTKSYLPRKIRHFQKMKNVSSWTLSLLLALSFDQKSESKIFTQPIWNGVGFICAISQKKILSADIKQIDTEKKNFVLFLGLAKTYIFMRKIFQFDNFLTLW